MSVNSVYISSLARVYNVSFYDDGLILEHKVTKKTIIMSSNDMPHRA